MDAAALRIWRKDRRTALIEARAALTPEVRASYGERIDAHLAVALADRVDPLVAFCWPLPGEYDARGLMDRLRARGAQTALPVVVAPRQPMIFRRWTPGEPLATGVYGIQYPAEGEPVVPDVVLLPMIGFDEGGQRLGYGGGFFDRTLAGLREAGAPVVAIGVAYELARLPTIDPQPYDVPMDVVVTEACVYERLGDRLVPHEGAILGPGPASSLVDGRREP